MTIRVTLLNVDEEHIAKEYPDSNFETEMGWVEASGIYLQDTVNIPEEIADGNPIETAWLMRKISDQIDALKEDSLIENVTSEDYIEIIKEVRGNFESVEQDVNSKIYDVLSISQKKQNK